MTKVLHIQIATELTGRAALRLHKAFLKAGLSSQIITLNPSGNDDEKIVHLGRKAQLISTLNRKIHSFLMRNNIPEFGSFSYPILGTDISKMKAVVEADFIYIHWALGGFLNLNGFEKIIKRGKPVIFFMHDMWNITGGCHHSFECRKYETHCYDCQVFPSHKKRDLSYKEYEKKKKLYSGYSNIYFVAPSKWLYNCALHSKLLDRKPVFHIPNYIDNSFFKPIDKKVAKQVFNINESEIVIAFGAIGIGSPYKGWEYLVKGLEILKENLANRSITILVFGNGDKEKIASSIPFKTKFVGYLSDEYSTMICYNATDVFVAPSLADNFPTTILESLSCGTPVVGFDVGGIPDLIEHKKNGFLARYKDSSEIYNGIIYCIENKLKGYLPEGIVPEIVLQKHKDLFAQINPQIDLSEVLIENNDKKIHLSQ